MIESEPSPFVGWITRFTYPLLYEPEVNFVRGSSSRKLSWWIVNSGQSAGKSIG
ncbi:MAG: hypothetical protein OK457_04990 [Thaumarchaeota archaeon]|nr:hypothetical protein [Nitrososphaerota archaeon]